MTAPRAYAILHAMKRTTALAVLLLVALASPVASQGIKGRELFGVRIGGVFSTGAFKDAFGDGTEIELHFIEGITPRFGVSFSLSSHDFGDSKDRMKNIQFINLDRDVDLQVYSVTVGPLLMGGLGGRMRWTIECGAGLYAVSAVIPTGIYEGTVTDNQFGFFGGAGLLYRITERWLAVNLNAKYHYFLSGDEYRDTIWFYTGEERTAFYQIALGVMLFTG